MHWYFFLHFLSGGRQPIETAPLQVLRIVALSFLFWSILGSPSFSDETKYFEIQVVDSDTGRGVPLVELTTTDQASFFTDSAGRIAFHEPDLMDREVYFSIKSHGYEMPADGFGFRGVRLTPKSGARAEVKITRKNIAERLYRITGEGIYRDSELLGKEIPAAAQPRTNGVVGQDSAQCVRYRDKLYWFWGDTSLANYPLGIFRTAGATSPLPGAGTFDPAKNIPLTYWVDKQGRARNTIPLADDPAAKEGVVWVDGVVVVTGSDGKEKIVCRFERRRGLERRLGHGLAVWNDDEQVFKLAVELDLNEKTMLSGHPLRHREGETTYILTGHPVVNLRVAAKMEAVLDPKQYEAWTCIGTDGKVERDASGKLQFGWKQGGSQWTIAEEARRLRAKDIIAEEQLFHPRDVAKGQTFELHAGSVRWNEHRKKWLLVANQIGGTSQLGEVWYSEADAPTGPWKKAIKIITHEKYSFYNPVQREMFDADGGRFIFVEGTYSHTFSGNNVQTPRYEYNQMLYRLDLADKRLKAVSE